MKKYVSLLILFTIFSGSVSAASYYRERTIVGAGIFYSGDKSVLIIDIDGDKSGMPACASTLRFAINSSAPHYKEMVSIVMTAYASVQKQLMRTRDKPPLGGLRLINRAVLFWDKSGREDSNTLRRFPEPMVQSAFLRVVCLDEWASNTADIAAEFFLETLCNESSFGVMGELILFLLRKRIRGSVTKGIETKLLALCDDQQIEAIVSELSKI